MLTVNDILKLAKQLSIEEQIILAEQLASLIHKELHKDTQSNLLPLSGLGSEI